MRNWPFGYISRRNRDRQIKRNNIAQDQQVAAARIGSSRKNPPDSQPPARLVTDAEAAINAAVADAREALKMLDVPLDEPVEHQASPSS